MALKIYTKTGDLGKTSLIGGTKVPKSHIRIDTYGTVDELNAYIGLLGDSFNNTRSRATLKEIQDRLFTIGSSLACDPDREPLMKMPDLKETDITFLEREIDTMNDVLPVMKFFVLPGDTLVYPAHDYKGRRVTTIEQERVSNARLGKDKPMNDFIALMASLKLPHPQRMEFAVPGNQRCGECPEEAPIEFKKRCSLDPQG